MRKKPYTPKWKKAREERTARRAADPRVQARAEGHARRREEFLRQQVLAKAEADRAVRAERTAEKKSKKKEKAA